MKDEGGRMKNCHPERTREGSCLGCRCKMLREYAQHDTPLQPSFFILPRSRYRLGINLQPLTKFRKRRLALGGGRILGEVEKEGPHVPVKFFRGDARKEVEHG